MNRLVVVLRRACIQWHGMRQTCSCCRLLTPHLMRCALTRDLLGFCAMLLEQEIRKSCFRCKETVAQTSLRVGRLQTMHVCYFCEATMSIMNY